MNKKKHSKIKTYSELKKLKTFDERFNYLKLNDEIGNITFGHNRYLNQKFYRSKEWLKTRREIILRDSNGHECFDLGDPDHPITGKVFIHHINPIKIEDISDINKLLDPNNLICVSYDTHNALHYGTNTKDFINGKKVVDRKQNDTCPWK